MIRALLFLLGFAAVGARAGTATVTNAADSGPGTLREAISLGGTIGFSPLLSGQPIILTSGQLSITNSVTIDASMVPHGITISGNHSSRVFEIFQGNTVELRSLTITEGREPVGGAGIYNRGSLTLLDCTIVRNSTGTTAVGRGGGVRNWLAVWGGSLTIDRCTITENEGKFGGGLYSSTELTGNPTRILNSTISGNRAFDVGGGVANAQGLTELVHCTITDNTAPDGEGSGLATSGDADTRTDVQLSIIAGNANTDLDLVFGTSNSVLSIGTNLVGDGNATNGFANPDIVGVADPVLAPLGYYGGPTLSRPPLTGSPAIDAAVHSTTESIDQRGFPRPVNTLADIGATELGPIIIVTNTADAGPGTLRQAVLDGTNVGQIIRFDTVNVFTNAPNQINLTNELVIAADQTLFIDAESTGLSLDAGGSNRIFRVEPSGTLALHAGFLRNGFSPGNGGAVLNEGDLNLIQCGLTGHQAGSGGAIYSADESHTCITDTFLGFNSATNSGGGMYLFNGNAALVRSTIQGNNAGAGNFGGGIENVGGAITLTDCTLTENSAGVNSFGGGLDNFGGDARLIGCTVSSNTSHNGGGLSNGAADMALVNTTLSGNFASTEGGGLYAFSGRVELDHCTVTQNEAPTGMGSGLAGNQSGAAVVTVSRSIIADNVGTDVDTIAGTSNVFVSADWNLIGTGNATNAFVLAGDTVGATDILLTALDGYGGPTQTHLPRPDSPAIDAIPPTDSPRFDQRGYPRPVDGNFDGSIARDIGAVETDAATIWGTDIDGDGSPYGVEVATGTDPNVFTPNANGIQAIALSSTDAPAVRYAVNTNVSSYTAWIISRANHLVPGDFTEIYRLDGPSGTETVAPGESFIAAPFSLPVHIGIDSNAPNAKAFYRLEAEYVP